MRLGELLHSRVTDAEGTDLGRVRDARLVQDGPVTDGRQASLRLDGLVVGAGSLAIRLGYHRRNVRGPALLRVVFAALERRARYVPWGEVAQWDGKMVLLHCNEATLPRLSDIV